MTGPRPKYDPRIERRHGPLLDTLVSLMGHAPRAVVVKPYYNARGATFGDSVTVAREGDEDSLLHELGHFWSMKEGPLSVEAADSLNVDPYSEQGSERLADAYAGVLRASTGRGGVKQRGDVELLQRLLARARAAREAERARSEGVDSLVRRLNQPPR